MGATVYTLNLHETEAEAIERLEIFKHYNPEGAPEAFQKVLRKKKVGRAYYLAMERTDVDGSKNVWALVVIAETYRNLNGTELSIKYVSEESGPVDCECPLNILSLLSPTHDKWALEWRQKCRVKAEHQSVKDKVKKAINEGMEFRVREPLTFKSGRQASVFQVVDARKLIFKAKDIDMLVKLRRVTFDNLDNIVVPGVWPTHSSVQNQSLTDLIAQMCVGF